VPRVTIRTGLIGPDGQEVVFTDHLCDWPDCVNVAEHVVGVVPELGVAFAACREHAALLHKRTSA
jgi:hypothetical protein